ncbi:MFS family permease [Actinoplanes octamycinicus]|uniref:MFS family permease n=1 Tax=Actinoplanes octamycinicus TaxID=135948 RepID=A0A7W7H434_9ACTN|nr:MFS transporter [Actinoplanes octamycinicus]MBB4743558.1 MFS family permease [Actinoplanes octamycinicus]GIE62453.1 MFS transporter [Actinoplanes octamycinicus]
MRGPQRALAAANLAFTVGSGLYLTAGVLYFTEAVGLPAAQVGLGLGVAGVGSLAAGIMIGHLADRVGARGVYLGTLLAQAVADGAFLLTGDFPTFLVVVCLAASAKTAGFAARTPLIRHYGGDRPQEFRGYLRAVTNLGIAIGAPLAGWAVQVGTLTAYRNLVLGMVAASLVAAAILTLVPGVEPLAPAGRRWIALRDRRYLLLTVLDGVMAIQFKVLTVAMPLWLIGFTAAPRWLVSVTMATATGIVVLFQVRASRGVDSPAAGGRAYRRAGLAFLLSCSLIPLAAGPPAAVAAAILIVAVMIHAVGQLWNSAGGFEVSFALAPAHATGQYLGVFGLGAGLADTFGPALVIWLCLGWGRPGWFLLGAILALTGCVLPVAVRRSVAGR